MCNSTITYPGALESDQNQTRLFNHPIVAIHAAHWLLGNHNRFECGDYNAHGKTFFQDDFWEISVRFNSMISRHQYVMPSELTVSQ